MSAKPNQQTSTTTMTQNIRSALSIGTFILLMGVSTAFAQSTGTVMPNPKFTGFDNSGLIVGSGRLCTYAAGATTPQPTYSDVGLSVANTNPIVLDPAGRATVFLSATSYKFVLRAAGGTLTGNTAIDCAATTQLWSVDNVSAIPTTSAGVDVLCTAGEAITAGQVVYWSDGSGSKNAGQCYKADNANAYSATTNWVGVAPSSIASAGLGTVRIAGTVTTLSGLTIGLPYYIGTAGAVTATAPATNARKIGQADSATSLVVYPRESPTVPFVDDFRLSLTTATCETTADVTAAVTLYLTPCTGNRITLFDTSGNVETCTTAEISIAVPATTSQMYDVYVYDSTFGTCTVTLELLAWTNDTTRATATTKTSGSNWRYTKSGNTSRLFVGSFRTTTVSGQTEDSVANRLVGNYYNQKRRHLKRADATASWAYGTATIRQVNAAAANQVTVVVAQPEVAITAWYSVVVQNDTASVQAHQIGIGLDSTTAFAVNNQANTVLPGPTANMQVSGTAHAEIYPAVGYHTVTMLEKGSGTGVTTWYGTGTWTGSATLLGWIEG